MSNSKKPNLLFALLILFIVILSTTTYQLSPTSYVYGKSDKGSNNGGGNDNGSNGHGHNDGGSDGDGSDGDGSDGDGSDGDGSDGQSEDDGGQFLSQVVGQTAEGKNEGKLFYVLIDNLDNETNFVPDKVTLTTGSTVVWFNNDNSDHTITLTSQSKSDYPLLNSLILPKGMVDYEFQSAGTYSYSDLDNPQSDGVITILSNAGEPDAISKPLKGIDIIINSSGLTK